MRYLRLLPPALLALLLAAQVAAAAPVQEVTLEDIGRTTAPGSTNEAEIAAYDPASDRVFVTNAADNALEIFDFSVPSSPTPVETVDLSPFGSGPSSVAVSPDGLVAVAQQGTLSTDLGTVQFFDTDGNRLDGVRAGALPDMLTFTKDGRYLLVANEGEPDSTGLIDPDGSVTVVDLAGGLEDRIVHTASLAGVPLRGPVRVFTPNADPAQDMEPEYITARGNTAYVALQEANAIGVLDIPTATFSVVRSLGFKEWSGENVLDSSNGDDGGISLRTWDHLFGMYQPDAIASYRVPVKGKKRTFIATANEGDARDNDLVSEEADVAELTLDSTAFDGDEALDSNLGELKVTDTLGDTDGDGDYDRLYAFGGRSLSILDADGKVVFDTGGELEQVAADLDATNFNKSNTAGSPVDNRSDDKGPEPEALAIGKVEGHLYAFLGSERSGGLYAYDLSAKPGEARFAGYLNTREADLGPEGALFVSAGKSPTGQPLVLFTYEISSTVAAYEVTVTP